jgi:hypothetical protein
VVVRIGPFAKGYKARPAASIDNTKKPPSIRWFFRFLEI